MLLKDDDLVRRYQKECKEKNEFVRRVLDDWLSRDDRDPNDSAVPRTWSSLAECISDADLPGGLATAINEACAGMNERECCSSFEYTALIKQLVFIMIAIRKCLGIISRYSFSCKSVLYITVCPIYTHFKSLKPMIM